MLRSQQAVMVNIQIVRAFVRLREILATHKDQVQNRLRRHTPADGLSWREEKKDRLPTLGLPSGVAVSLCFPGNSKGATSVMLWRAAVAIALAPPAPFVDLFAVRKKFVLPCSSCRAALAALKMGTTAPVPCIAKEAPCVGIELSRFCSS